MFFYQSETYQSDLKLAATSIVNAENLYGKTVLVTGASGMIVSFIVDTLVYLNRHFQAGIMIKNIYSVCILLRTARMPGI